MKTAAAAPAESALDSLPPDQRPGAQEQKKKRKRLWTVARIVDYRLQFLAPSDPEYPHEDLEWCDLGRETYITCDRETAYQNARAYDGLLMSTEGLPASGRCAAFAEACKAYSGLVEPF